MFTVLSYFCDSVLVDFFNMKRKPESPGADPPPVKRVREISADGDGVPTRKSQKTKSVSVSNDSGTIHGYFKKFTLVSELEFL